MTMHLVKGLTTLATGKKTQVKYKSAEEKRQHLAYLKWQDELKSQLKTTASKPQKLKLDYSHVRETQKIASHEETVGQAPRKETRKYEGERKLIGIATMHKSNMQPVFDTEYAKEIARMRRG